MSSDGPLDDGSAPAARPLAAHVYRRVLLLDPAPEPADAPAAPSGRGIAPAAAARAAAWRRATRLARAADARLTLVDVVPEIPDFVQRLLPAGVRVPALLREARLGALGEDARRARRAGVDADALLLEGSPIVALVREVQRGAHALLVLALPAPDDHAAAAANTRRLAQHLVRKAPCAVLLVPPGAAGGGRRRRRVLAAIDVTGAAGMGDERPARPVDSVTRLFAMRILRVAALQAALEGAELHVLHVWAAYGEGMLRAPRFAGGIDEGDVQRYVAAVEAHARASLDAVLARCAVDADVRVAPAHVHLVKGDPAAVLPAFVAAHGIDTVVLGTVARSGFAGLLVGNTAEGVMETLPGRASCAMLVVKPDGFVSPIVRAGTSADPAGARVGVPLRDAGAAIAGLAGFG